MVPDWYPAAEKYDWTVDNVGVPVRTHKNALEHPRTGVQILDDTPRRLSEVVQHVDPRRLKAIDWGGSLPGPKTDG